MEGPELDNLLDGGYGAESYVLAGVVTAAANIRFGTNPPYEVSDFIALYPQFGGLTLPPGVLQAYINLASSCVSQARWCDTWQMGMSLYVAHFVTLYLQASAPLGAPAKQVAGAGLAKGIQVSKSVGDVSVSYQSVTAGWEEWGQWNLTSFGQQFMGFAKMMGAGPMYIW